MGTQLPLYKKGTEPLKFRTHLYCGQRAGWIKMALGTEVGLGLGHIALDGDPAPLPKKGAEPPSTIFGPVLLSPNGWIYQDATWYVGRPQPRGLCVRWEPSHLPQKGAEPLQIFGPCLLWPNGWMDQDGTCQGGRPQLRRLCVRWESSSPSPKGAQPPIFGQCPLWPNGWMD